MVLAEAIGLDKDKPNRVTKVAVKMLKCMWCLCPCKNDPFPFPANSGPQAVTCTCSTACLGCPGVGGALHTPPSHHDLTLFLGVRHQVVTPDPGFFFLATPAALIRGKGR